jgi:hypothetical protein
MTASRAPSEVLKNSPSSMRLNVHAVDVEIPPKKEVETVPKNNVETEPNRKDK